MNLPEPSGKAKYSLVTDSELVPWGKGEKHPSEGSEIDLKPYAYKRLEQTGFSSELSASDSVPFA